MVNDSLTKFANTLYAEATEEKVKIEKQLEENERNALAKCDAELAERYRREEERARRRLENEKRLTISRREVELMTELRETRQAASDEVIQAVEKKLYAFADSDEYLGYLKREAAVAGMFSGGAAICSARECDIKVLKELFKADNFEFETAKDEIIGGFVLRSTELGLLADCTLRNKLGENKGLFLEISGLVIE